jgi:type II secretory pathway predicted ATPase ExeA
MFLSHFGLKLSPFRIEPDPHFLWLGETHREKLAALEHAILESRGFLLLSGAVGTGKTVLIHHCLQRLAGRIRPAVISDPGIEIMDLYRLLADEFEIDAGVAGKADFLIRFKEVVRRAGAEGQPILIVIDEAHRLVPAMFDELRVLAGTDFGGGLRVNVLLVGQEELHGLLRDPANQAVRQQIAFSHHLRPLEAGETPAYIRHRLAVAGGDPGLFSAEAEAAVHRLTQGTPRMINALCDRALLTAYLRGEPRVEAGVIGECAAELELALNLPRPPPAPVETRPENTPAPEAPPAPKLRPPAPAEGATAARGPRLVWGGAAAGLAALALGLLLTQLPRPGDRPRTTPAPADRVATAPAALRPEKTFRLIFRPGSAEIEEQSLDVLAALAEHLAAAPQSAVMLVGAAPDAPPGLAAALARLRADALQAFLSSRMDGPAPEISVVEAPESPAGVEAFEGGRHGAGVLIRVAPPPPAEPVSPQ